MTAPTPLHRTAEAPLRTIEAALLGALFLGVVAMLSLPAPGWAAPWLALAPGAGLAMAAALRLSRRSGAARVTGATPVLRRRRPVATMATRRRGPAPRPASRLLAALALR